MAEDIPAPAERPALLVSACLLGVACNHRGEGNAHPDVVALGARARLIPICPEVAGGLPTPRPAAERHPDGRVRTAAGDDVTGFYDRGAAHAVAVAQAAGATRAVLKARSPSCGSGQIYDGSHQRSPAGRGRRHDRGVACRRRRGGLRGGPAARRPRRTDRQPAGPVPGCGYARSVTDARALSSVGRAPPLQGGGRGFESLSAHRQKPQVEGTIRGPVTAACAPYEPLGSGRRNFLAAPADWPIALARDIRAPGEDKGPAHAAHSRTATRAGVRRSC